MKGNTTWPTVAALAARLLVGAAIVALLLVGDLIRAEPQAVEACLELLKQSGL